MKNWQKIGGTAALTTLMTGTAGFADVTAQEVWGDWKNYMQGFGYTMQGTEATAGDTLTVSNLAMSMELPDNEGNVSMSMDQVAFKNNGDGTVSIMFPAVMPIVADITPKVGEDVKAAIEYTQKGFTMVVSGDATNMTYNYTAVDTGIALKSLEVEGKPVEIGKAMMLLHNVIGSSDMKVGNLRSVSQTFKADSITYDVDFKDPEGKGHMVMGGTMNALGFDGKGDYPTAMDPSNMSNMLKAGFNFDGTFTYQGGQSKFNFNENGDTFQGTSSSDSGSLTVAMGEAGLQYGGTATGTKVDVSASDLPLPIALEMATSAFNLAIPVIKGDQEQDFALGFTMGDFTMSDMIWGLFDPAGQLPRDPATLSLDLSGKVKLFLDLMDPEEMAKADRGGEAPGEIHALDINNLVVSMVGADLTGKGGFTFDNSDVTSFDGMPKPTGAVDLQLVGGNSLLDKLVAMGLLPEDQAMGARMMMGLFAVPGDGEDTLKSKIEINDQGHVLANGQRLK